MDVTVSPEIASFIFGALLILIAILGGGFDASQLKIPKVGLGVRIVAFVGGVLFVLYGFELIG
jgi:hypothetical protein